MSEHRQQLIMKCVPAWVVAVDMGYGHQRAAQPLTCMAYGGKVINANSYPGIPQSDRQFWAQSQSSYEWVSRLTHIPFIGQKIFNIYDKFQEIAPFYPKRDLSGSNIQLFGMYHYIHKGWGRDLIEKLNQKDIPLITTFFAIAFMAEEHGFRNQIYCVVTDTDISRSWVAENPNTSRIKYLCPNKRTMDRLKLYGVRSENLFLTGFPLPLENIGDDLSVVQTDILNRLPNLDPQNKYLEKHLHTIEETLDNHHIVYKQDHPLTVTFAVGGAGAQREIGIQIVDSLQEELRDGKIHINLISGIHNSLNTYFKDEVKKLHLRDYIGQTINILHAPTKEEYFIKFNELLRKTDVLWTKPSEMSFYCALGIPIIMSPAIGSQEKFNRIWLKTVGAGIAQEDPRYTNEWLFEWLDSGWLAEAAMEGYIDAPKFGTYNIAQIVSSKPEQMKEEKLILQY